MKQISLAAVACVFAALFALPLASHAQTSFSTQSTHNTSLTSPLTQTSFSTQPTQNDLMELRAKIKSLMDRYAALKAQLQKNSQPHTPGTKPQQTPSPAASPVAECTYQWTRTLDRGSRGSDVSSLQKSLRSIGYFDGDVTGYYGTETEAAVKKFQSAKSIVSMGDPSSTGYGVFGSITRATLLKQCAEDEDSDSASYGIDDVKTITRKSVDPVPHAIDDEYGLYTITLKNGKVFEVKVYGLYGVKVRDKLFADTGYIGSVSALMALAVAEDTDSGGATLDAALEAQPDEGEKPLAVTFTVNGHEKAAYTLDFGDRSVKKRVKDGDTVEHTYKKTGTFVARLLSRVGGSISLLKYNHNVSGVLDTVEIIVSDEDEDGDSDDGSSTFTISDVKSVTKKSVDPIPLAVDDEYSLYTITLKNGDIIRVKSCGFCTTQMREKLFTDKGFEGSVSELMSLASNENNEDEDTKHTSSTANSCVTPYLNKSFAHGTYVEGLSAYFSKDPTLAMVVVSPAMLCQNGSWTHGGFCNVDGVKCSF